MSSERHLSGSSSDDWTGRPTESDSTDWAGARTAFDPDSWGFAPTGVGTERAAGTCPTCGGDAATCWCAPPNTSQLQVVTPPRPPLIWLYGAVALAVLGAVAGLLFKSWLLGSVLAWAIAGPASILVYGKFVAEDTRRSAVSGYGRPAWMPTALRAIPVLVVVAVGVAAWGFASWMGRHY